MSGEQEQTPPDAAELIDQQVAQHRADEIAQSVMGIFSPEEARIYGAAATANRMTSVAAAGSSGGYEFSPDQIDTAITKFTAIHDKAKALGIRIQQAMDSVGPPAPDGPSVREMMATRDSLQKAHDHNKSLQQYAQNFLDKLDSAKKDYLGAEQVNSSNARQQG